jgi:DNA-binding MarR family transcriptional regulator
MKNPRRSSDAFAQFGPLFFETRQIIRQNLCTDKPDPNAWLRFETLRFIGGATEPTMQDIAKHLRIAAPSATSLIAHLSREHWITRRKSATDKRIVRIVLTQSGKQVLADYQARSRATMRRVFSKLPPNDLSELIRILRHVGEAHKN